MWKIRNTVAELDALRREIDRVFEGYTPSSKGRKYSAFLPGRGLRSYPLMNVSETAEEYTVEALAPGLDPEMLEVTIKGKQLTLSGQKKELEDVEPKQYHRNERSAGQFTRTLTLESDIDDEKLNARYANGLIVITIPKAESAKPKNITVSVV